METKSTFVPPDYHGIWREQADGFANIEQAIGADLRQDEKITSTQVRQHFTQITCGPAAAAPSECTNFASVVLMRCLAARTLTLCAQMHEDEEAVAERFLDGAVDDLFYWDLPVHLDQPLSWDLPFNLDRPLSWTRTRSTKVHVTPHG